MVLLASFTPSFAQAQDNSPLTPTELRENASYLVELKAARERIRLQEQAPRPHRDTSDRERQLAMRELELQKQLLTIAERERDAEKRRGDDLDAALKLRNKK